MPALAVLLLLPLLVPVLVLVVPVLVFELGFALVRPGGPGGVEYLLLCRLF